MQFFKFELSFRAKNFYFERYKAPLIKGASVIVGEFELAFLLER